MHSDWYFYFLVRVLARKTLNLSPSSDLVDVEVVLLGNSEYTVIIHGVGKLFTAL